MRSLDPKVLEFARQRQTDRRRSPQTDRRKCGSTPSAEGVGRARIQMTARLDNESDAFEDVIPVQILASPETVAAYGEARPDANETLAMPAGVVPGFGGLHRRALVNGDGRPWRGRALSRRISRTAARSSGHRARSRCCWPPISAKRFSLPGIDAKNSKHLPDHAQRAREVPVSGRRIRLLAGRLLLDFAVSDRYVPHVFHRGRGAEVRRRPGDARAGLRLPENAALRAAAGQRRLVAGIHGLAGIRREGAGRGWTQSGLATSTACTSSSIACRSSRWRTCSMRSMAKAKTGARVDELQRRIANAILPEAAARTSRS